MTSETPTRPRKFHQPDGRLGQHLDMWTTDLRSTNGIMGIERRGSGPDCPVSDNWRLADAVRRVESSSNYKRSGVEANHLASARSNYVPINRVVSFV